MQLARNPQLPMDRLDSQLKTAYSLGDRRQSVLNCTERDTTRFSDTIHLIQSMIDRSQGFGVRSRQIALSRFRR